jgi:hypothetical protein
MGAPLPRPAGLNARLETLIEEWPYLDEGTLLAESSMEARLDGVQRIRFPSLQPWK